MPPSGEKNNRVFLIYTFTVRKLCSGKLTIGNKIAHKNSNWEKHSGS